MKKMTWKVFVILFSVFIVSCSQHELVSVPGLESEAEGTSTDETINPPSNDDSMQILLQQVCFPGESETNPSCLEVTQMLNEQDLMDYNYSMPIKKNGFPYDFWFEQYRPPVYLIDLQKTNGSEYLSENFQLHEFMHPRKGRYAVYSPLVIRVLQIIRDVFATPLVINSGYRSPAYNSHLKGSAKWSRHMYGDAVDMYSPGKSLEELAEQCESTGAFYAHVYTTHVHCDWRSQKLENGFYGDSDKLMLSSYHAKKRMSELITITHRLVDGSVEFSAVNVPADEDPDDMKYEWKITFPDGHIENFDKSVASVSYQKGTYIIWVEIAGSLIKQVSIAIQ